jgi:pyrroloquinoline quinone biosynthesis protein D
LTPDDATPALDQRPRIGRRFRLQFEQAQQAWVLLFPEGMVKLNTSAAEILRRCDGASTLREIVADLERAFGSTDLERDVLAFVDLARGRQWLEG